MTKKAFTMIEILIVIAIAMILMAIAIPVTRNAIRSAKVRQSCFNLKQIHVAISLYRQDHGGDGKYGAAYWDMGLPPDLPLLIKSYGLTKEVLIPPGVGHLPFGPRYYIAYRHISPRSRREWEGYSLVAGERSVLVYDITLDDTGSPRLSRATHYYIGMYLDGLVKPVRQTGWHGDFDFWLRARGLTGKE